jgi:hypothetical protein
LTINDHRESWRGNAFMDKINEIFMKTFTCKSRDDEMPLYPIESFGKINF